MNDIKKMITSSQILTKEMKEKLLKNLVKFSDIEMHKIYLLLGKERTEIQKIEAQSQILKSAINKKYIEEIPRIFKTEEKKAMKEEEKSEKAKADKILNNL